MKNILFIFILFFNTGICSAQNPDFIYSQTCYGSQTLLTGSSTFPDSEIEAWQWDVNGDSIIDMFGKNVIYFFTTNNTIPVTLKITLNNGFSTSTTKNVIIDPLPNVNFHVNNVCENKQAIYTSQSNITSGNITQFLWDFNNDGITDDISGSVTTFNCGPPQSFITKLTCISDKGCSAFTTKSVIVYPQPEASFSFSNLCEGQNTSFTNSSVISSPDFFLWNFGDGESSLSNSPTHQYNQFGQYTVSLIASSINGCRDTTEMNLVINPAPIVTITCQNNDSVLSENGENIMLVANGAMNYLWSNNSTSQSINIMNPGIYSVTGTDGYGCQDSSSIEIISVTSTEGELVSNIITPNGDGINDKLEIRNLPNNIKLEIFNMWNDKVYSTYNYNNDWGGTGPNGSVLPDGAYYYIIMGIGETKKGTINILSIQ